MKTAITDIRRPVGDLLREWRRHRRMSQLALAAEAEVSTRHLSFVESGRAQPSREMILRLCQYLDVPLRERKALLVAAGFAPAYREHGMDSPRFDAVRQTIDTLLRGFEPYPMLAVNRHWQLLTANASAQRLMAGVPAELLQSPINVLRLSLHPTGLAPRIRNLAQWRDHLLERLRQQIAACHDIALIELLRELEQLSCPVYGDVAVIASRNDLAVPLLLDVGDRVLSLWSTTTVFGTPMDITLAELALEAFVPANEETAAYLRKWGSS
ncbi:MAG TPA: helix-turn-helix transcriptional regulator [Dyella sp.]|uniref:helix-turn-helix domain-containing protein n=1 Tax=Dyella sp. TaxID=1869338 RepID=UPI002F9282E1